MIRYPFFIFISARWKMKKTEKPHVLYMPSFCFLFCDSIIENREMVIKFPFHFT